MTKDFAPHVAHFESRAVTDPVRSDELGEEVNELAQAAVLDLTDGQCRTDTVTCWSLSLGHSVSC